MDKSQTTEGNYWGYLIKPDRTAAPLLEQLCIGLTKIIRDLEPGPDEELTPQRLAAFYRSVGGNYDTLLLGTSSNTLSFMYMTLGCFHSLQPTTSPFEIPTIPCLTPTGFARWQTLQVLLSPEDNVRFLQKAVQIYEVPRPDGGYFPKNIPSNAFPDKPDEQMETWYAYVTRRLNTHQDNYMRRIKSSPYQSPYPDAHEKRDGYFAAGARSQRSRRSSPTEEDLARMAAERRRSSVPDIVIPKSPVRGDKDSRLDRDGHQGRKARSHSAHRPTYQHTRQRSHTTTPLSPHKRDYNSSSSNRYGNPSIDPNELRPISSHQSQGYSHKQRVSSGTGRPHSTSPGEEAITSDGSPGSSPNNRHNRSNQRKSDEESKPRKNSLWIPSYLQSHKRRHSSDATYRTSTTKPNPSSLRPEHNIPHHPTSSSNRKQQQPPQQLPQFSHRPNSSNVRFRNDIFHTGSGPETPIQQGQQLPQNNSRSPPIANAPPIIRYPPPPPHASQNQHPQFPNQPRQQQPLLSNTNSNTSPNANANFSWDNLQQRGLGQRRSGFPTRVATVTGVGGRKYANNHNNSNAGDVNQRNREGVAGVPL